MADCACAQSTRVQVVGYTGVNTFLFLVVLQGRVRVQILSPRPSSRFDPKLLKMPVHRCLRQAENFQNRLLGPTNQRRISVVLPHLLGKDEAPGYLERANFSAVGAAVLNNGLETS